MPRRYSDEEVKAIMVPELVRAIYPVLIPVEQQDMKIQARNHDHMTILAAELWKSFQEISKPCPPHRSFIREEGERAFKVCQKCGHTREMPITNNA